MSEGQDTKKTKKSSVIFSSRSQRHFQRNTNQKKENCGSTEKGRPFVPRKVYNPKLTPLS